MDFSKLQDLTYFIFKNYLELFLCSKKTGCVLPERFILALHQMKVIVLYSSLEILNYSNSSSLKFLLICLTSC